MKKAAKSQALFDGHDEINVKAYILGQRLNTKNFRDYPVIKNLPLMVAYGGGVVVLFRYGVVVFFAVEETAEAQFLDDVAPYVIQKYENMEVENVTIRVHETEKDHVTFDAIYMNEWDVDHVLVVADILAKSQMLSCHEKQVAVTFDKIDPISSEMHKKGRPSGKRTRDLMRHLATTLTAQRSMAGQAEILDKPDFLWEKPPALQGLYVRLEDEYEIRERYDAVKEKLELIYRTSETMIGLVNSRHTLHVEWYIVALIVIEIFISLYEKYQMHG